MDGAEAHRIGFYNNLCEPPELLNNALQIASTLSSGPTFAHSMTKSMLHHEWNLSIEAAVEAEAQAQAICMRTNDFRIAYEAFINKQMPQFRGN
jgi:enoyl-CoA hydratase/carnithine racemase